MLSFAYKRFDGVVPEPGDPSSSSKGLDDEDRALLEKVEAGFQTVGDLYNACKFRAALGQAMALAREANVYLDRKAPCRRASPYASWRRSSGIWTRVWSRRSTRGWKGERGIGKQEIREPGRLPRLFLIGQKAEFQILLDAVWTTPAGSDHRFSRTPPSLNV